MNKLLLSLTILLSVYACNSDKKKEPMSVNESSLQVDSTLRTYIVFMKGAFAEPLIKSIDTNSLVVDTNILNQKRIELTNKLKGYFVSKGINVEEKKIFVDVSVGAVLNINSNTVQILLADSININAVIQDLRIQININPIQQTDPRLSNDPFKQWLSPPVAEINPIQQNETLQNRFDINPTSHMTSAISAAGGFVSSPTSNRRRIWFLDTGIDTDNPNLNVDDSKGTYFIGTSMNDDNGHGTFCAGVAAGKPIGNVTGFPQIHIGVSEGAWVVPVKVLDKDGEGLMSNVYLGLDYVAQKGAPGDIVNLSLGAYDIGNFNCYDPSLPDFIHNLETSGRMFVTMAAGNNSGNAKCNMPGCINGGKVFTVSSVNADLTCAEYANFNIGNPLIDPVDYVTVGTRVFSLWDNGGFRMASGTSVSSAIVAGIIHARGSGPAFSQRINCVGISTGTGPGYKLATR